MIHPVTGSKWIQNGDTDVVRFPVMRYIFAPHVAACTGFYELCSSMRRIGGEKMKEKKLCVWRQKGLLLHLICIWKSLVSGNAFPWSPSWQKGRRGAPVGWSVGFPLPFSHLVVLESSRWGRAQAGLRALWGPQWQSLAVSVSMRTWVEFIQNFLCTCGCSVL